ncbi:4'-phosphopantetheinyl transferase family protein [Vibrio sp. WXL210]|uniref:4'-phosphopantetheinyl transferase family protein n=1 Tax=Vibrio sp. WXL210 TaxID=3450709 RepID=UPI003EC94A58
MTFIINKCTLELPYLAAYCEICQFKTEWYQVADFKRYGVECPVEIADSVSKRQAEYLAGRYLAKSALQRLGCNEVHVGRTEQGEPLWPEGIAGSITHSRGYAVCVVALAAAPGLSIGLDIEALIEPEVYQHFLGVVITQDEEREMSASCIEKNVLYTLVFSAKESIFKALFPQVRRYFDFLDVSLVCINGDSISFRLNVDLGENWFKGKRITVYWLREQHRVITYTHS